MDCLHHEILEAFLLTFEIVLSIAMLENIYLTASILGLLISISLIVQIFTPRKANFFVGLIALILSFEMLFSWGARSGYNNLEHAFPISLLLNYMIVPPSLWLFVNYQTDDNFTFRRIHLLLYLPAMILSFLEVYGLLAHVSLRQFLFWPWLSDYVPLMGSVLALAYFWISFIRQNRIKKQIAGRKVWLIQLRLLALMTSLTIIVSLWLLFSFIGWRHFYMVELVLVVLFFGLSLLNYLENQSFHESVKLEKPIEFPQYDDQMQLGNLRKMMESEQIFLQPSLPLKEFATRLDLPPRYVSYLINRYHEKNYKEYINEYRVDTFLQKAKSGKENHKTLLALALESGFSSKSTFNQVFKNHRGKSPSEYLS